jgi:hypothetical protein
MKTTLRWAAVALVALLLVLTLPSLAEAQGCVAVTYGCGTSGPQFTQAEVDAAWDIIVSAGMLVLMAFLGSGTVSWN